MPSITPLYTPTYADSSAARQNGYKVIVIDAPFPPTLKKSALGVALTEQQVEQRYK